LNYESFIRQGPGLKLSFFKAKSFSGKFHQVFDLFFGAKNMEQYLFWDFTPESSFHHFDEKKSFLASL
jgi:hypothetical protein